MSKELRILILEDVPADAELVQIELSRAGIAFTSKVVQTKEEFVEGLKDPGLDAILADFNLPHFNAREAFRIVKELKADIPFILVTGSLGEEVAVECIKEGMDDYILKGSLKRLPTALLKVIEEKEHERTQRRLISEAESALKDSEKRICSIVETANDAIVCIDENGLVYLWNRKAEEMFGYSASEMTGMDMRDFIVPERLRGSATAGMSSFFGTGAGPIIGKSVEFRVLNKDGTEFPVEISISAMSVKGKWHSTGIIRDITARKAAEEKISQKIEELERFKKATIEREIRMKDLRIKIEKLEKKR